MHVNTVRADVVIVGGGLAGLNAALAAAEAGPDVIDIKCHERVFCDELDAMR